LLREYRKERGSRSAAQQTKERGGNKGGAGNPGPVYGQKDQVQHPRETKRETKSQKRRGRRGREEATQRRNDTNKGGKEQGQKKR